MWAVSVAGHTESYTSPAPLTWRSHKGCQLLFFLPSQTDAAWSTAALPHDKETYPRDTTHPTGFCAP